MQRGEVLKTVSITQITSHNDGLKMTYSDLLRNIKLEVLLQNLKNEGSSMTLYTVLYNSKHGL